MAVFGAPSHPQVLFQGFDESEPAYQAMAALVPSARIVTTAERDRLRLAEWDVLVSKGAAVEVPLHMHVLALGCVDVGTAKTTNDVRPTVAVSYRGSQVSEILFVDDHLPDACRRLVLGDLVPWLRSVAERPFLTGPNGTTLWSTLGPTSEAVAFVRDADHNLVAGAFPRARGNGSGWCWALPYVPDHPEQWLAAALADWHEKTPKRVPLLPGWQSRTTWRTADEAAAVARQEEFEAERARVVAGLDERDLALRADVAAATTRAEAGARRLLTAQGDDLVAVVTETLATFGFDVENVDDTVGDQGPKVEDLRISDPDDPAWTNITEVRGYTGGAKVSDLQRLARFTALYTNRTGALPSSVWYVVNQFLGQDPDTRSAPLAGSDDDVAVFAEGGGLVVDTRELFRLLRRVEGGETSPEEARKALRGATGVFGLG